MRVFHIAGEQIQELDALPTDLPAGGFLWVGYAREEFEQQIAEVQAGLHRWGTGQLVDLHVSDLLNKQLPSHFDYTSWYDLLVFRRLAAPAGELSAEAELGTLAAAERVLSALDTSPVGFAVFDRVLITVHPSDCLVRDFFADKLGKLTEGRDFRGSGRLPTSPAELMLRMVNHIVDNYLDLRRILSRQLGALQKLLLDPHGHFENWPMLLASRDALHRLEDSCEDQRSAMQEWLDALDEWPDSADPHLQRERELLRVRSRDVLEHIERVLSHVRRHEASAESAVQMHFSALSHRTNSIMRTLTVLTAIFLPLNLITGIFGMNFETLPLIHRATGFWIAVGLMAAIGLALGAFFWRKRYLSSKT
ncbi:magnesium transporter CorA family protein [Roseateles violae]|uniref:Magnesium transporter CorA family protein n=1 Tax=Roseateles violae TaxID=3058042 RepID=A0ABT8DJR8_9BURK|nr:magnesium transporter CorA family protein [Pelomonas sp. PFR6]MDN3918669.1 magnesium transporter CorA family protein [Pelomonas sp. PFR6]